MKIVLFIISTLPLLSFSQGVTFEMKGEMSRLSDSAQIYLYYMEDESIDTIRVKEGEFHFSGEINAPAEARIIIDHDRSGLKKPNVDVNVIFLEKGTIRITGTDSIRTAIITGTPANDDYQQLEKQLNPLNQKIQAVYDEYAGASDQMKNSELYRSSVREKINQLNKQMESHTKSFIQSNLSSLAGMHAFTIYSANKMDDPETEALFKQFSPEVQNSYFGKEYTRQLSSIKYTAIGAFAPDFTQNNPSGNPVKLSDFRGKYVLLDFWASWCGPCRKENPTLVRAYHAFKDKGFTILGVSLDGGKQGKTAWLNAIEKDGLEWTNVSDLKDWKNEVAQIYGVKTIPQNFLLDPEGKIIAKNLRGESLYAKLIEIFGE